MTLRQRRLVAFGPALVALGVAVFWGLAGLPAFGSQIGQYAQWVNAHAPAQLHVSNIVSGVVFGYRGWDTLGEESILFAAVMGTALLLRSERQVEEQRPRDLVTSDLVRGTAALAIPLLVLLGVWTTAYGYITPGGGFQGGVVAAAGALFVWVAGSYRQHRQVTPAPLLDATEGLAVLSYVAVGAAGVVAGTAFLDNVVPGGSTGTLTSGGVIGILNWATGLAVAAALLLVFHEFLEEHIQTLPGVEAEQG